MPVRPATPARPAVPASAAAIPAYPAAPEPRAVGSNARDNAWMVPFFVVLGTALAIFVWQVTRYTTLLG
jgi:hypothetical protein